MRRNDATVTAQDTINRSAQPTRGDAMSRVRTLAFTLVLCAGSAASLPAQARSSAAAIQVVGGPRAGKYTLAAPDVGCMISERGKGPKRFSVTFGIADPDPRAKDPKALTHVAVNIRNVGKAGPPPLSDYEASVTFGPVMDARLGTFYMSGSNTTTGRKGGTGTVILEDRGQHAQVTLDLQPQAGVAVHGTVTCKSVLRY